jgi:50S ribosomal protein L16 3-hydroxylase
MNTRLLGGLSAGTFLKRYWQKRPCLVRQAMPGFEDPFTMDELAGLALEPDVASRLVMEKGGKTPWQLSHGPFSAATLKKLPRSHWTLLVQGVDQHVPAGAAILDQFDFVPNWRVDDLMVSFAPPQGTVGAHVDSYDVFLIQGQGRRRWQIAETFDPKLVPGLDLKILAKFKPEKEWVLEPGDMLYLPPGVAHYGVALEDCLTYSVGFRAPKLADLIGGAVNLPDDAVLRLAGEALYGDPDLKATVHPGELDGEAIKRVRGIVMRALLDDEGLARWLGGQVTKPGTRASAPAARRAPSEADVRARMAGAGYERRAGSHFAYARPKAKGDLFLFIDGEEWRLAPEIAELGVLIGDTRFVKGKALAKLAKRVGAVELIRELVARGLLA